MKELSTIVITWFRCRSPLLPLLAMALMYTSAVPAQTPPARTDSASPETGNRWLLIVQTSRSMQARAKAVERVASILAASGMNGQMRAGDTLGLWTFNDDLHAGEFPLQIWAPGRNSDIAERIVLFLQKQKYEKEGRIERVVPEMQRLIRDSPLITILLISEGRPIRGISFDAEINKAFDTWGAEQERAGEPFITLLRAAQGNVTNYLVNMPPWPMQFPALPKPEPPPQVAKPKTSTVPPLILYGKGPRPVVQPAETGSTNAPATTAPTTTPAAAAKPAAEQPPAPSGSPEPAKPVAAEQPAPQTAPAVLPPATPPAIEPASIPPAAAVNPATEEPPKEPAKAAEPVWQCLRSRPGLVGIGIFVAVGAVLVPIMLRRRRSPSSRITLVHLPPGGQK